MLPNVVDNGLIDVENGHAEPLASSIKLEPNTNLSSPPTDFETLIDRRPTSVDPCKIKSSDNNSPPITSTAVSALSSPTSSSFSSVSKSSSGQLKLKSSSVLQQMDVDDNQSASSMLSTMKYPLNMENKLINKVKIVVDNISGNANSALKSRLDVDANTYHLLQPPPFGLHQSPFQNYYHNFHMYEFSQNNQNYLNQHRGDPNHDPTMDENMWRPW